MGEKVVAVLSPSEGFYSLQLLSTGEHLCLCWDGAVGEDGDAGCIPERYPEWGYSLPPPPPGWSPHPGARAGVNLLSLPTVGLKAPLTPQNLGVLHPPVPLLRALLALCHPKDIEGCMGGGG